MKPLEIGEGWCYKTAVGRYLACCESSACIENLGLKVPRKQFIINSDGRGEMEFPYDQATVTLVKSLPGARWNPDLKNWHFPLEDKNLPRVIEVAEKVGFDIPQSILDRAKKGTPQQKEAELRAATKGLFDFQREGVKFLALHSRAVLGDSPGLGKTIQGLVALPEKKRVLVICPASLKFNWLIEAEKWRPDYHTEVIKNKKEFRLPKHGEILITNYESLPKHTVEKVQMANGRSFNKYISSFHVDGKDFVIIADEIQKCKSTKTANHKNTRALGDVAEVFWALTGTPLMNKPPDLWGILSASGMQREVLTSYNKFLDLFNAGSNGYGTVFGMPKPEVPERMKRVMIRRDKYEVLKDLPKKTFQNIFVNGLDRAQKKRLDEIMKLWEEDGLDGLPDFSEFAKLRGELAEWKIPTLLELVDEFEAADEPVIVFSAHKAPIKALLEREGWTGFTGELTDKKKRIERVEAFQRGEHKGFAVTIGAGAEGITLTKASNMIFVDLDWVPGKNIQAEDRIVRIGSTGESVLYKRIVWDHPLERHVLKLLEYKMELIRRALDKEVEILKTEDEGNVTEETVEEMEARRDKILNEAREIEEQEAKDKSKDKLDGILQRECDKSSFPVIPLNRGVKYILKSMLEHMVGECDGARSKDGKGFNKPDAMIARHIARVGVMEDEGVARVAERILSRYHRQLIEEAGFPDIWNMEGKPKDMGKKEGLKFLLDEPVIGRE